MEIMLSFFLMLERVPGIFENKGLSSEVVGETRFFFERLYIVK